MKRSACLAVLLVAVGFALAATPSLGSDTQAPRLGLERVALDGDETFQGNVLPATVDGNEIIAVDTKAGRLYRFHENATELGKSTPIPEVVSLYARAMAAAGDRLAVAGAQSIAVFSERGDLLRKLPLFMPGDIEPDGAGSWLVSVTNIPTGPDGGYLGRTDGNEPPPRVIRLDADLEIDAEGLRSEPDLSASQAAGRELDLSRSKRALYAVEFSRYRILELNRKLEVRAELAEPSLALDEPKSDGTLEAQTEALQASAEAQAERRGRTLAGGNAGKPATAPIAVAFAHRPLVRASIYDPQTGKLLLLLDGAGGFGGPTLDVVDPDSGDVQRFALPEMEEMPNQLVAGRKYIWMRARSPGAFLYRIPRLPLVNGSLRLVLPENTRHPADEAHEGP